MRLRKRLLFCLGRKKTVVLERLHSVVAFQNLQLIEFGRERRAHMKEETKIVCQRKDLVRGLDLMQETNGTNFA